MTKTIKTMMATIIPIIHPISQRKETGSGLGPGPGSGPGPGPGPGPGVGVGVGALVCHEVHVGEK